MSASEVLSGILPAIFKSLVQRCLSTMGFGKDGKGVIIREQATQALLTLAANTALIIATGDLTITEDFRMLKSRIAAHVDTLTAGDGEGLMLGIANGNLSVAEIAAVMQLDGPADFSDRINEEVAERFVYVISQISESLGVNAVFKNENGGPIIEIKPRWSFSNTDGWNFFVYNDGGGAFTTGAVVRLIMTHYGVWLK